MTENMTHKRLGLKDFALYNEIEELESDTGQVECNGTDVEPYKLPVDVLCSGHLVKVCAPMVRYSGLAFRTLVRKYGCDLAFTPMIVAESFVRSLKARDNDFFTNTCDRPLVVQFAANNVNDIAAAAEIVSPFADGVDLNCGCPQRWALQEGYGASLIRKPQLMADMISGTRRRISNQKFTISVKIRIHDNLKETVDLCRKVEAAGASWITVHGRTTEQRGQPVNLEAIRLIKDSVHIPVIANGDIRSLAEAEDVRRWTGINGVMAARGILANPAMFAGYSHTPIECVSDWVDIATRLGTPFQTFHNHLIYMMENVTPKSEKRIFNSVSSTTAVIDYLQCNYGVC